MNTDWTNPDEGAIDEPALTGKNTETIRGEEILAGDAAFVRTSYGAAGGTTDATEEGGDGTGI
jgi:hypothetical protein